MRRFTRIAGCGAAAALAALSILVAGAAAAPVAGTNVLYTGDADFDQGALVNLNHSAPNGNQLQLNEATGTFPFIWVALSVRCTIAKINTTTGAILGEYRTLADDAGCNQSSRTTVALDGSVWVGHRGPGGVTHVGLAELNQCVDRNANGTIETSTGYGDVLPWTGMESVVASAQDECILHHVDTNAVGLNDSRHMSIDPSNNLWVGDYSGGHNFVRINGNTGAVVGTPRALGCGGYGGLIDGNGVIWSANGGNHGLLRWDPNAADSDTNPRCIDIPVYGLAIDPNGFVWAATLGPDVRKVSPDGDTILGPFAHGAGTAQGLAVSSNGDVWVSSSLFCFGSCTIGHLKNDGTFVGNVDLHPTGAGSTGISVDAAGKIWAANLNSNSATRIDPSGGPIGLDGVTRVGAVDLSVGFPAGPDGRPHPSPYNYSDMTGAQLLTSVTQGLWTVTQDAGAAGAEWGTITWNTEAAGNVPSGAAIKVEARVADTEAGLGGVAYTQVSNGAAFSKLGRFIQVRATLTPNDAGASPVLSDVRIQAAPPRPEPTFVSVGVGCAGDVVRTDVVAHGPIGSGSTITLYRSSGGAPFVSTGQSFSFVITNVGAMNFRHDFDVSALLPATYKAISSGGVESGTINAPCGPGHEIPEASAALLLPLSILGTFGIAAGVLYVRRRKAEAV